MSSSDNLERDVIKTKLSKLCAWMQLIRQKIDLFSKHKTEGEKNKSGEYRKEGGKIGVRLCLTNRESLCATLSSKNHVYTQLNCKQAVFEKEM